MDLDCIEESFDLVSGDITYREEDYSMNVSHYLAFEQLETFIDKYELVEV